MKKKIITLIAAMNLDGVIGYANKIPWHNKTDLLRFKELTTGGTVILGRKTYESLPPKGLPERTVCVISSTLPMGKVSRDINVFIFPSIEMAIKDSITEQIWIAGGAKIYQEVLKNNLPDFIDLTIINEHHELKGEVVKMPEIPSSYSIVSEVVNENDKKLLHRKYCK